MKAARMVKPLFRYMVTTICLTIIVLIWLYLVYFVNNDKIAQAEQQLQESQKQVETISSMRTTIDQLDTQVKQVRLSIANQKEDLKFKNGQAALSYILEQAKKYELSCGACSLDKEIDKDWYTKHLMSLELKGQLGQILAFLDTLKQSHTMIQAKNITLTQAGDAVSAKTLLSVSVLK